MMALLIIMYLCKQKETITIKIRNYEEIIIGYHVCNLYVGNHRPGVLLGRNR